MAWKPVGADENGKFPPRVDAALKATYAPRPNAYDIIVVAGQSNATKRSALPDTNGTTDDRIYEWKADAIQQVPATDVQWIGNGFAREYIRRNPGRRVLIVPTANGSTGFTTTTIVPAPAGYYNVAEAGKGTWDRTLTADPINHYAQMIAAANAARTAAGPGAKITALLWSQGESDRGYLTEPQYAAKLDDLINTARTDLAEPNLPVIIGSMTPETIWDDTAGTADINRALIDTPRRVQRTAYVWGPPDMVEHLNSRVHWAPQGQAVRGKVMASDGVYRARLNMATGGKPVQAQNVRAVRLPAGIARVTWEPAPSRVTAYTLETSTDGGTTWAALPVMDGLLATEATFYADPAKEWMVQVKTTNETGTTDPTRPVYVPPVPIPALHSLGLNTYSHRYVASTLPARRTTTWWQDVKGSAHFKPLSPVSDRSPQIATENGRRFLYFDGTSDVITAPITAGDAVTFVMVARVRATDGGTTIFASGQNVLMLRAGTGGTAMNAGASLTNTTKLDNTWRVVVAVADGTNFTLHVDGVKVTGANTALFGNVIRFGANGTPATFSPVDVMEAATYPTAVTDLEAASIRDALKAAYPGLLL